MVGEYPFFTEVLIVLIVATIVALTFERIKLPAILGFFLAGIVIGPRGLCLIEDTERVHDLAELGIIFLMLAIGIEFSFGLLRGVRKLAILGGSAQIIFSILIGLGVAQFRGWSLYQGFIFGSVIALSSTALVLKLLMDRGEVDTEHGKIAVAILIFQDLAFVPLLILAHTLGQEPEVLGPSLGKAAIQTVIFVGLFYLGSRFLLIRILDWIAQTRNREIFFLTAFAICLGAAWLSAFFGLSMAIGAFFAGLMLANTPYGSQIAGEINPFRHVFVSIFFVSIGLLFDPRFAVSHVGLVLMMVGLILTVNFFITTFVVTGFGYPPRVALAAGLMLAQIGEFSFLLLEAARQSGAVEPFFYQASLSAALLTIFATPFLFRLVTPLAVLCERVPILGAPPKEMQKLLQGTEITIRDHIIVCGFGRVGRDLVSGFQKEKVPFIVVDLNSKHIEEARRSGMNAIYGDAGNEEVMRKAGIDRARAVAVSFGDAIGMHHIIHVVERLNPETFLIVRTRYERNVPRLYEIGADMVVMEELEASLDLNRHVLKHLEIPPDRIEQHLNTIRLRKELSIEETIFKRATKG